MSELLEMKHICKRFPGVKALDDVQLTVKAGEVHALLGENGAGKSTLIKVLGGIYTKDEGEIHIDGKQVDIHDVESARANGVSVIHQELMSVPYLSVAENIFLGQEETKSGFVKKVQQNKRAQEILDEYEMDVRAGQLLGELTIAQQQMVEIIRAISFGARIIVMDEPTSSLSTKEVDILFDTVRKLKERKIGIIYISHRMAELDEIADRITIMRDGQYIDTVVTSETPRERLVALMVGRELSSYYTKTDTATEEVILEAEHLSAGKDVLDASFNLRRGEILGFSGLVGAGRSETMKILFGLQKPISGTIRLNGEEVKISDPKEAIRLGIGMVPEDRKDLGLFQESSVRFNMTIDVLKQFIKGISYSRTKEMRLVDEYIKKMSIKVASPEQLVSGLSGGNQQKVLISRWLMCTEKILILDEPTRGVDVKTKAEIYYLINELAANGLSIIMVSSELPELINMSDRVVVMCHGRTTGILDRTELDQEKIMTLATTDIVA